MKRLIALALCAGPVWANPMMIEDFSDGDAGGWSHVSDRVMGGVSDGAARLLTEGGQGFARLEGRVSTANNGGFIQIRRNLPEGLPDGTTAIRLTLRGNGAPYYVHLRTTEARRPWQYFQARFETTGDWQQVDLPLERFTPIGGLRKALSPTDMFSIGIVAYGADYTALLDIEKVETISAQDGS